MNRATIILTALTLAALPLAADDLPIVEKAIDFHGGDLYEHSEMRFEIASRSGSFDVEIRQDGGMYRYAVIDDTDEGRRSVIATNDDVTVLLAGEPQDVSADREQRLRDFVSARIYFPLLPYRLADPGVHQEDLGVEEWPMAEGRTRRLHKVKVTFEAGSSTDAQDEYLYWFDPDTGRLEQLAYSFRGGLRFRVAENFRRVGGILFSDQENYGIDWEDQADALPVDVITPSFVEKELDHISTVRLRDIWVEELD